MKKLLIFVGVGCLSVVLLIVVAIGGTMAWAAYQARQLDSTPTRVERTIQVRDAASAGTASAGAAAGADGAFTLDIDLSDGRFTIQPGPAGSELTVEGSYAEGYYELTETRVPPGPSGGGRASITFRPSAPLLVRILGGIMSNGNGSGQARLTVSIPEDLPMALSLRVGMGEARIDLGGLALTELRTDLSMGNHALDFSRPVAREMASAELRFSMGEVAVEHLGNARARRLDASSSMSSVRADLGGEWTSGTETELSFTQSMGELQLRVPRDLRLDVQTLDSSTGENRVQPADPPDDPDAPVLRLRLSTSMAESRVTRY
jgi:hypothetical protein